MTTQPNPGESAAGGEREADMVQRYLRALTDAELIEGAETAHSDLLASEPQSERQADCFAGLHGYCGEMNRRGLKRPPLAPTSKDGEGGR